ncbi:MAG TPA: hypothetical protein VFT78_13870 [Hanamia sp.]|nr:hypothetical protein [Hanamia sp.]
MSTIETVILIFCLVLLLGLIWMVMEISAIRKQVEEHKYNDPDTLRLRLQAYERITLLTERIALQNLLSRHTNAGLSCRQMQMTLIDSIKQEYEYNMSQQIYVSPEVWRAVNNLKEQNIYIINQLAATLPAQASGMDLNKHIIDYLINNSNASLHNIVLEAINYEAKKLM